MTATREDIKRRLMGTAGPLPSTLLRRLRASAGTAWRGRHLATDPDPDEVVRVVLSLGRMKGIAMKMGQIMSYIDVALPDDVRDALAALQTHSPPMPFETVARIIRQDLGPRADELLERLEPRPIAAASIGQVHRGILQGRTVAVKVQYPEVRAAIDSDFAAARMAPLMAGLVYPGANIAGLVAEAQARFTEECDYRHETAMQQRFAAICADDDVLYVPEVFPEHSGTHVLTTEFIEGQDLDAFLAAEPAQGLRDRFGAALFRFYIGTLFSSGLYNCDPHPGNYLIQGERIALLDHGCVRAFPADAVQALARLTLAVHADDDDALRAAMREVGFLAADDARGFPAAKGFLRAFQAPMLRPGRRAIRLEDRLGLHEIMQGKRRLLKVGLPPSFLFLLRIRFGLFSVLTRLAAEADWHAMEVQAAEAALSKDGR